MAKLARKETLRLEKLADELLSEFDLISIKISDAKISQLMDDDGTNEIDSMFKEYDHIESMRDLKQDYTLAPRAELGEDFDDLTVDDRQSKLKRRSRENQDMDVEYRAEKSDRISEKQFQLIKSHTVEEFLQFSDKLLERNGNRLLQNLYELITKMSSLIKDQLPQIRKMADFFFDWGDRLQYMPFEYSRVIVDQVSRPPDVINASKIAGLKNLLDFEYIASEPLRQRNMETHLKMLWQNNIELVIVLGSLERTELERTGLYQYYDKDVTMRRQNKCDITIEVTRREDKGDYEECEYKLKNPQTSRRMVSLQYRDWPESRNPNMASFRKFFRVARKKLDQHHTPWGEATKSPVLVICPNGTTESGLFIALDMMARCALGKAKTRYINVYRTIGILRVCRPLMVETEEQLKFIFEFMNDFLRNNQGISPS